MKGTTWLVLVLALAGVCWGSTLAAQEEEEGNQAAVAKAVMSARVSLERGLVASASHGQPISAKFELEEGKLQLSVYTRSEEHTSELQSHSDLVCRLLLEKKKKNTDT